MVLSWVCCSKILVALVRFTALRAYLEELQKEPEMLKAEACVELLGSVPPKESPVVSTALKKTSGENVQEPEVFGSVISIITSI